MRLQSYLMLAVNIRELKDKISYYIREVVHGETILVTDRGKVVAELRQPSLKSVENTDPIEESLWELAKKGVLRLGSKNDPNLYENPNIHVPRGTVEKLLSETREDK